MKKILAEIKTLESKLASPHMDTIEHLDGYFVDCAKDGQGINSKETVQMRNAMVELLKEKGIGEALDLQHHLKSPTSQRLLRDAVLKIVPGFDKLFAAKTGSHEMTCADFFDSYMDGHDWDELVNDMYWGDDFSSEQCFKHMQALAKKHGVKLTDEDTFGYDDFFYKTYKDTEKGLS